MNIINDIRKSRNLMPFEKRLAISKVVIVDLGQKGFLVTTDQDQYFFWDERHQLLPLGSLRFTALIEDWYTLNKTEMEWKYLAKSLATEAIQRGVRAEVHKFARYQDGALYVSRFDGQMYRLDGNEIQLVPNGSNGILFLDDPAWQPYKCLGNPVSGCLILGRLIADIHFAVNRGRLTISEQHLLVHVWLQSLFFESLLPTKPILAFIGPHGSGKTSVLRSMLKFLFGEKADVQTLAKDKEDAFMASVSSDYLVAYDNVDEQVRWLSDHLATTSTGGAVTLRKLYTTNEKQTFYPKAFLCLTSRTPRFRRPDVADRLLLIHVDRIEDFRPEAELVAEILQNRDALWTEMLVRLNKIVEALKTNVTPPRIRFRMADFAKLAWRIADHLGYGAVMLHILEQMELDKAEFALAADPLLPTLSQWLETTENAGREVSMRELFDELQSVSDDVDVVWTYETPQSLGTRISNVRSSLENFFDIKVNPGAHRKKTWQFWPKEG